MRSAPRSSSSPGPSRHDAHEVVQEGARATRGRDPEREWLLPREGARGERGVERAVAMGMQLVDDVGRRVEAIARMVSPDGDMLNEAMAS